MFSGIKACMIRDSIELSKKRWEILSGIIKSQGGIICQQMDLGVMLFIGKDAKHDDLSEWADQMVSPEWISGSMKAKTRLDISKYLHHPYGLGVESDAFTIKKDTKYNEKILEMLTNQADLLDYGYQYEDIDEINAILKQEALEYHKEQYMLEQNNDPECQITHVTKSILDDLPRKRAGDRDFIRYVIAQPEAKPHHQLWEPKNGQFICMAGSAKGNYNKLILEELEKLNKCYRNDGDKGRHIAYSRAIGQIKSIDYELTSEEQVEGMPNIGKRIKDKIVEIINTGTLKKAESLSNSELNRVVDLLQKVWGIGTTTAIELYRKGIKSLEQLKQHEFELTKNQQIGLKYYDDFQQRIPRDEATEIYERVLKEVRIIEDITNVYEVIACGSYRRGKESCGDMDILLTRKDNKPCHDFLLQLVENLKDFLVEHLTTPKLQLNGSISYMGICKIRTLHRRIDIKLYPLNQFGYAVLYFTGSDQFNRSMRLAAQKSGYTLSDLGVFPSRRGAHNQIAWKGKPIPCQTEMDVFKLIGMEYKQPEDRSL